MTKGINRKALFAVGLLAVAAAEVYLLLFLRAYVNLQLTSDDSSELILANLLARQHRLLTTDWYYSTEIRLLNTNLIYVPFFWLFDNWHRVRMWSLAVMHLIYLASAFLLCKSVRHVECFPLMALALVLPLSADYYTYMLKGGFYIPHLVIAFVAISLVLGVMHAGGPRRWVFGAISVVLAVVSCMGGARQVVNLYLPLALCAACLAVVRVRKTGRAAYKLSPYRPLATVAAADLLGAAAGYFVNTHYLARHYLFKQWDNVTFVDFDWDRTVSVVDGFLTTYGFNTGQLNATNALSNLIAGLLLLGTVASIVYALRNPEKVSKEYLLLAAFFLANFVTLVLLYSMTSMTLRSRYTEPVAVFSYLLIPIGIRESAWSSRTRVGVGLSYVCAIVLGGALVYTSMLNVYRQPGGTFDERSQVANLVADEGYTYGYGTFWPTNVMTELSNGRLEMHILTDGWNADAIEAVSDINTTYKWLQYVSHDTQRPEGKVCILLTTDEYNLCLWRQELTDDHLIYSSDRYKVFGFDSYEAMIDTLGNTTGS